MIDVASYLACKDTVNYYLKNWHLTIIFVLLSVCFFSTHDASAVTSISWDAGNGGGHSIFDGNVSPFLTPSTTQFTVTDTNLAGNGISDKINVLVNSTSDPSGITLTLSEIGDSGTFTNTNIIFTNGTGHTDISSPATVGLIKPYLNTDPNAIETIVSGPSNFEGMEIFSSSDSTGIFMNLTETGKNTGIFTNTLHFTTGPSINGSSIHVNPGEIVTMQDVFNSDVENILITPNPDPAFGVLPAQYLDEVDAVYNGVKEFVILNNGGAPGGGGGGLIRPGLVLDILASIGGSPYIVSPPSFGGESLYSDGLTLIQGANKTTFDISQYNQEIPKQVMVSGQKVNMTFKTFESYNPTGVIHMGLFIIPRGEDMLTTNSLAWIQYDKYTGVEVHDPNHILVNATASSTSDGKFQHTQFSFIPTKSYDKMSFLARAWNDHLYSTDVRIHDEVIKPPTPKVLPNGVFLYRDFNDLQTVLEKDKFYKSQIMAHIHGTNDVFNSCECGQVYWLYDTINHNITLIIADNNGDTLYSFKDSLDPYVTEPNGDYNFMKFTVQQLNRWDQTQEENAKKIEEAKALLLELEKGLSVKSKW